MTQPDIIQTVLKDTEHHLSLFREDEIYALRERVFTRTSNSKETPFVKCIVRGKDFQLRPEEIVRQLYAARLINRYGYSPDQLAIEYPVSFGLEKKRADIVIRDKDRPDSAYTIVEVKKPKLSDGKSQLRSYCNATGAPIGVWTNGRQISHYNRKEPNYFEDISDIPNANQRLEDVLKERFTLRDLIIRDKVTNQEKSLKELILEMEDEVLANAGVDVFEEVFKLIFTKLYDEFLSQDDKRLLNLFVREITKTGVSESQALYLAGQGSDALKAAVSSVSYDDFRVMEFRNSGQTDSELKNKIQSLFARAVEKVARCIP